jgi:hypothetical protein
MIILIFFDEVWKINSNHKKYNKALTVKTQFHIKTKNIINPLYSIIKDYRDPEIIFIWRFVKNIRNSRITFVQMIESPWIKVENNSWLNAQEIWKPLISTVCNLIFFEKLFNLIFLNEFLLQKFSSNGITFKSSNSYNKQGIIKITLSTVLSAINHIFLYWKRETFALIIFFLKWLEVSCRTLVTSWLGLSFFVKK